MEDAIVLYPSPAMGHLISMVELGKLILRHHPSFSIHILITHPPYNTGSTTPYINRVSAATPIAFHHLPAVSLPLNSSSPHHETLAFEFLTLNNPNVRQALLSLSHTHTLHALVIDLFCTPALSVAADLKIPPYYFFTSAAHALAIFLHMPEIHRNTTKSFKELRNTYLHVPGLRPILATDMPTPVLDRTDKSYDGFLNTATHLPKTAGIIVNTFDSLESRILETIREGLCVSNEPTPPVYCIGPLIASQDGSGGGNGEKHECLKWLDSQPSQSVVFLCFGSLGLFSKDQLMETAMGLERSGQRFLWVVRSPPLAEDDERRFLAPPEPDLDSLLPEGFLGRTRERGLVVKSWSPQLDVLSHDSVGGFVTHCGWNSVLEAVCAGQPMVAWPLYAEQRINRVVLVEELKLALPMTESEDGFVSGAEVEKRVRELMDSEEGKLIREEAEKKKEEARAAMSEAGSSRLALAELVRNWKTK